MNPVRVVQPLETLHGGGVALSCALDGTMSADALHGLFAADTRLLSTYRVSLGGVGLEPLSRARDGHGTALWHYQNRTSRGADGVVPAGSVFVALRRRVDGAMHDDLHITSFLDHPLRTTLVIQIDADFADIFEVKRQHLPPRVGVRRTPTRTGMMLEFRRRHFQRALHVSLSAAGHPPVVVGSRVAFDIELVHGATWRCCIEATPEIDGQLMQFGGDPHIDEVPDSAPVTIACADVLAAPFRRGCADLQSLTVTDTSGTFVAAGVPWFLALFGRDTLMTSLMTGLIGSDSARGALRALGALQASESDDWRDAEPGKLPHELRRGELAERRLIPHTPYYGTHDAQSLYCLALWNAWRWTGDRQLLDEHFDTACAALRWCDQYGDRDGDGLQEYRTRSRDGYYNQSWKDAEDAIVTADGDRGALPLATVELQGYLYAARLAMAEMYDEVGDGAAATHQRDAATALAALVEQRFYMPHDGYYALALDGAKQPLTTIASNPGHLLWCGLPSPSRAAGVARRLVQRDLHTGWGLRTLSSQHPAYNPLSYQLGSVWPHDTVLAAAGLFRYGHRDEAASLLRSVLEAACAFEDDRLPELFAGFQRSREPPVPYSQANVPQAWAAAAPILSAQMFLGLVPDAPRHRCALTPWLPEWLPTLEIRDIAIGDDTFDVKLTRTGDRTDVVTTTCSGLEIIVDSVPAALWGSPMQLPAHRDP
jgi:glycogen debranching enzyme